MYIVFTKVDETYGNVVVIERSEDEGIESPFFAFQDAIKKRRLWKEGGGKKVRLLICDQIMTSSQADTWQREEAASLPKCAWCINYLHDDVYNHRLSGTDFFCSQTCADKSYAEELEKLKDEEEFDLL